MSHASVANYYCICMYMCYQIQNPVCRINLYQLTIFQVCIRCLSQMFFSDFQSGILMNFRFFNLSRFAGFLGWKFWRRNLFGRLFGSGSYLFRLR